MEKYKDNVAKLKELLLDCDLKDKNCFVVHAQGLGKVNIDVLNSHLRKVEEREGETDFNIISLIRFLFLTHSDHKTECARICASLNKFPFWPTNEQLQNNCNMDKIVFWSENHILMMLSSCYLFKRFAFTELKQNPTVPTHKIGTINANPDVPNYEYDLESELLKAYLGAHCDSSFNGVYEVNSHVYLPYALSALFNIYDFSLNAGMKEHANRMINNIIRHVLKCTPSSTGVANLSASARGFPRTRLRNWGHNINQLINLFNNNISGDLPGSSAITDFLVTTTWEPSEDLFRALNEDQNERQMQMNHPIDKIRDLYGTIKDSEVTPFYWSAGLVLHPQFMRDTKRYQKAKNMAHNRHLWPLRIIPSAIITTVADTLDLFTKGQVYCDIRLNIYKKSMYGLCLTSFEWFNPHISGFQQLPWIANVNGIGVWTQSGCDSRVAGFSITNTHNPCCQQRGSLLLVSYVAPEDLTMTMSVVGNLFDFRVKLFWPPESEMDEYRVVNRKVVVAGKSDSAGSSSSSGSSGGDVARKADNSHRHVAGFDVKVRDPMQGDSGFTAGVGQSTSESYTNDAISSVTHEIHQQHQERLRHDSDLSDEETPLPEVTVPAESDVSRQPMEVDTPQANEHTSAVIDSAVLATAAAAAAATATAPVKKTERRPSKKGGGGFFKNMTKLVDNVVDLLSNDNGNARSKDSSYPHTDAAMYRERNTWGVMRRGGCYIGVLCTRQTKMERINHKHGTYQPERNSEVKLPFNGRQCDAYRHSWVVIVATTAEYATMDEFINKRLFQVNINELGGDNAAGEPYYVEVNDPVEGVVDYM